MVQINFALKEVNCKIVYYGPGMSGKTTNLEIVHRKAPTANKGDLTSIATEGDRTLFFDFMPLDLGNIAGMRTKFQLYTVPGQVYYNSTRKLVLQGVDGIIFVADSQADKMDENQESIDNLRNNLAEYGKDLDQIPMVIQYNKRDLPNAVPLAELNERLNPRGLPTYEAVAMTGEGVFPTLKALSAVVLESLSREKRSSGAPPRRKTAEAVPAGAPADLPSAAAAATEAPVAPKAPPRRPPRPAPRPPQAPAAPQAPPAPQAPQTPAVSRPAASAPPPAAPAREAPSTPTDATPPRPAVPPSAPAKKSDGGRKAPAKIRRGGGMAGIPQAADTTPLQRAATPPRPATPKPPQIQKFVLDEDRGSPVLLFALGFIILIAVGVILYSFKIL